MGQTAFAPARAGELHPALTPTGDAGTGPIIDVNGLTKRFGRHTAISSLTFSAPRACIGLLGANGAGKTTLVKALLGLTNPTSGEARVLGLDTGTEGIEIRKRVGYMPESDCLPPGATAADFVAHMGEMSGLPERAARQRAADVLYQVGLREERYRLIKGFSTGMKQRVKLAQALVHDPALVFLDEPTNGMDPQGRDDMLELIQRIYQMLGIAVVVSSHILEDIERVCDHVVIIDQGRLVVDQPLTGMGQPQGDIIVRIEGNQEQFIAAMSARGIEVRRPGLTDIDLAHDLLIKDNSPAAFDAVRDVAAELNLGLRSLRMKGRSLEDLYLGNIGELGNVGGASD
jgi:ABC-2 type transport system ATP-binding protein